VEPALTPTRSHPPHSMCRSAGIRPRNADGRMMEGPGAPLLTAVRTRDVSPILFRSYITHPTWTAPTDGSQRCAGTRLTFRARVTCVESLSLTARSTALARDPKWSICWELSHTPKVLKCNRAAQPDRLAALGMPGRAASLPASVKTAGPCCFTCLFWSSNDRFAAYTGPSDPTSESDAAHTPGLGRLAR